MEIDQKDEADEEGSPHPIISLVEEEEVVLYWNEGKNWKGIRELACDDTKEDIDVLSYYRYKTRFIT